MSKLVAVVLAAIGAFALASQAVAQDSAGRQGDPRIIREFPSLLVGFEIPCTPQPVPVRGSAPGLPRSQEAEATVGEVSAATLEPQVVADILRVQAACAGAGVVFGPGESLQMDDGSEARVFHCRPASGVHPVTVVYGVRAGNLHRYSLWLASAEDLPREYPRFIASVKTWK